MTVVHRRSVSLVPGRFSAYVEVARELLAYHKANGVDYEFQVAFGGDASRVTLASRYESGGAIEKYYRKVMTDPAFLQLLGKVAPSVVPGSANDDFWREAVAPARPLAGKVLYVRALGIVPGRLTAALGLMKEYVAYFDSIGASFACFMPFGMGDPMRCALATRAADVAALEPLSAKMMADPRWHEMLARNSVNVVAGSLRDEMWLTM